MLTKQRAVEYGAVFMRNRSSSVPVFFKFPLECNDGFHRDKISRQAVLDWCQQGDEVTAPARQASCLYDWFRLSGLLGDWKKRLFGRSSPSVKTVESVSKSDC